MFVFIIKTTAVASFFQFLLYLILFVVILAAAAYFTKWYAKSGMIHNHTSNIEIVESYGMGPGKQIHIVRIGDKYLAVSNTKDRIQVLAEIDEASLIRRKEDGEDGNFKEIFQKLIKKNQ